MKKINVLTAAAFIAAFVVGGVMVSGAVSAQGADVACGMSAASVAVGQSIVLTATGGDGDYVWSSPGLVITNPTGTNFTATFNAPGTYPVTVASDGETATCNVVVTGSVVIPPVVPGLPNTGELPA